VHQKKQYWYLKMTLGERIKLVRSEMSQKDFCKKFKIAINTLRRYEKGDNPPDAEFLIALCREYDLNPTWLLTGKESMRHEEREDLLQEDNDKACDCTSTSRLEVRSDLMSSSSKAVDFDLLEHVVDEISDFRDEHPEKLSEEDLREVLLLSYSFCQANNLMLTGLLCKIVSGWIEKKEKKE